MKLMLLVLFYINLLTAPARADLSIGNYFSSCSVELIPIVTEIGAIVQAMIAPAQERISELAFDLNLSNCNVWRHMLIETENGTESV